jgi:hypothetical protein
MKRLAIFLVAFACLASAARADAYGPRTMVGIQAALDYWGELPNCPGGVDHQWRDDVPANWSVKSAPGGRVYAAALMQGCVVVFIRARAAALRDIDLKGYCQLIVHEYGHLLGHDHSADPNDIMADIVGRLTHFAPCDRAVHEYRAARRARHSHRSYIGDTFDDAG